MQRRVIDTHAYSEAEKEFIKEYANGHTRAEIVQAFKEKFGVELRMSQLKGIMKRLDAKTGFTGRFEKGQESRNKGIPMTAEVYEKAKATMFKPGHTPKNTVPVGTETIRADGYVRVKVAEPNVWRMKHIMVWEEANGPVPKKMCITTRDGDRTNTDLSNLRLVERKTLCIKNKQRLSRYTGELNDAATSLAEMCSARADAVRKLKGAK